MNYNELVARNERNAITIADVRKMNNETMVYAEGKPPVELNKFIAGTANIHITNISKLKEYIKDTHSDNNFYMQVANSLKQIMGYYTSGKTIMQGDRCIYVFSKYEDDGSENVGSVVEIMVQELPNSNINIGVMKNSFCNFGGNVKYYFGRYTEALGSKYPEVLADYIGRIVGDFKPTLTNPDEAVNYLGDYISNIRGGGQGFINAYMRKRGYM